MFCIAFIANLTCADVYMCSIPTLFVYSFCSHIYLAVYNNTIILFLLFSGEAENNRLRCSSTLMVNPYPNPK